LWLDLFIGFCDGLLAARVDEVTTDYPTSKVNANNLTQKARELADSALHEYEDRWPDVKLEGTRD
jgi:hypothetical protein